MLGPIKYENIGQRGRGIISILMITMPILYLSINFAILSLPLLIFLNMPTLGIIARHIGFPYYLTFSLGGSMMPSIPIGLTLTLQTSNYNNIYVGDVVSYTVESQDSEHVVHHRVAEKISGNKYITKGDANKYEDPIILEEQIEHKTVQFGHQPIYIPFSPLSIAVTGLKLYKKIKGEHSKLVKSRIETEQSDL